MKKPTLPKEVRELVAACKTGLAAIDKAMVGPSTEQRGKNIAAACNHIDMAVQIIERFGIKERKPRKVQP